MWRQYVSVFCIVLMMAQPLWAYYSPRLGRFLQRDQVGPVNPAVITPLVDRGAAFVPDHGVPAAAAEYRDGPNLYQYVQGNPLARTDPSGRFSLISILGATGFRMEASRQVLDAGEIVMDGAIGLTGAVMTRDLIMSALAGSIDDVDQNAFDDILLGYRIWQTARTGMMVAGVAMMGGAMLHAGIRGLGRTLLRAEFRIAAKKIVNGHAWERHIVAKPHLGFKTPQQLYAYVTAVMTGSSKRLLRGRRAWYDSNKGLVVIYDPHNAHMGTVFEPSTKNLAKCRAYYDRLK